METWKPKSQLTSSTLHFSDYTNKCEGNKSTASRRPNVHMRLCLCLKGPSGVHAGEAACSKSELWLHAELLFSPLCALYGPYFPLKAVSFPSPPQLYQTLASRGKIWLCCVQKPAAEGEKRLYKFWCQMFSTGCKRATVRACVSLNGTSWHVVLNKCHQRYWVLILGHFTGKY